MLRGSPDPLEACACFFFTCLEGQLECLGGLCQVGHYPIGGAGRSSLVPQALGALGTGMRQDVQAGIVASWFPAAAPQGRFASPFSLVNLLEGKGEWGEFM